MNNKTNLTQFAMHNEIAFEVNQKHAISKEVQYHKMWAIIPRQVVSFARNGERRSADNSWNVIALSLVGIHRRSPATNWSLVLHARWLSVIGHRRWRRQWRTLLNSIPFQLWYCHQQVEREAAEWGRVIMSFWWFHTHTTYGSWEGFQEGKFCRPKMARNGTLWNSLSQPLHVCSKTNPGHG